jgi:hypothetical protein
MNKDKLIEFAKEQCEIFPEDSYMGEYLRETLKMLQAEPCEDTVSREDVIKAVDRHTFDTDDGLCLNEDISIVLEELPPAQRWIPVSERLPKPNRAVLTYVNTGKSETFCLANWNDACWDWEEWIGTRMLESEMEYKVLAWMPLPKPYTEKLD